MQQGLILQENAFELEFYTQNTLLPPDKYRHLSSAGDGYVLQERIIVPPQLLDQANYYSARTIVPKRCNEPLIFVGHPELPVQYSSIIARPGKGRVRIEKGDAAINITVDGTSLLYSAPIFSTQGRSIYSFVAVFEKISKVLQSFQIQESAIARTWLYINDILQDYEKLNSARKQFFSKWHSAANHILPASTGIQGHLVGNKPLSIEFCAFSGEKVTIRQISSPLQNEPTAYGKLFSRAVIVKFPRNKLLLISGTAAIDKAGLSVHIGNFENQMAFTLEIVAAILSQVKGDFSNVAQAVIYLKRSKDMRSCMQMLEQAGFPRDRALFQLDVDVCRDELLFEIEVTALIA